jgi:hypothetical protein
MLVRLALALSLFASGVALADEGMWTFHNFPADAVKEKYGATINSDWLDRVQRSITRHESGCTGSFVSGEGLVLTNHHCVMKCLSELSSERDDFVAQGFNSVNRAGERQCPAEILSVLMDVEDVTAKVNAATAGLPDAKANEVRKQELGRLEAACVESSKKTRTGPLACESVTLYQGGQYFLYKYKRYDDVRMVFAPQHAIAAFGGDPDNFNFPRWSLDFSLLRAYENGKPARTPNYLSWRAEGPKAGEATFVAGHPGTTNRLLTVEQLKFQRDTQFPEYLVRNSELRGRLIQWGKSGPEPERIIQRQLQTIENSLKVYRGLNRALLDDRLMADKAAREGGLREFVLSKPELTQSVGSAWDEIANSQERLRQIYGRYLYLESAVGFNSSLFRYARQLVRAAEERGKPNELRLREYADSNLQKLSAGLLAQTPTYPELEKLTLSFSLDKMREYLGPDDPVVRELLREESPQSLAEKVIDETKLADASVRKALWDGEAAAVAASTDPMIVLARTIDAESRSLRKIYEDEVQAPVAAAQERIAKARFAAYGTGAYPDATFTLRLSYGAVTGWEEKGEAVEPFTTLERLYERATGKAPFELPQIWLDARDKLDMTTRFNYVTTNDIIGGNSGSPLIDAEGRLVGLAFDGNIHSLSGNYWYDAAANRAVAVHPAIILTALEKVYGANDLVKEITRSR